jgi:glutathione S-transferase
VPVLVDGDEVVSDSKRIIQYLEWRYGSGDEKPKEKAGGKPAKKEAKKPEKERERRTPRLRAGRRGKERKKRAEDEDR